ncbi:hypothetical protein GPJ56_001130 [Histomonas meleagridis]|uniref:uncharacterized protein n=1 Tax=Histomonas meleagridis TaxID=135588 RepID=UPI00355A505D|nr:hypothetical protein GPJ56_001130 [Histomonas meleagridis]KAH0800345.1 hypothetical protein GO595_006756 [Histomonas meleagridis]
MNNKEDVQNLQYVTWEEYGEFVSIPTDKPVCVYFLTNIDLSEAMQNDYNNQAKDKKIQLEKYINVNTDLLIAGDNIPFVVKFMTKPFMKVIYYILEIFSYSYLLDMIFYSNCKVLVVNSSKRAEIEPMYRAKAGEMDLEAPTSIFKDEKAESP